MSWAASSVVLCQKSGFSPSRGNQYVPHIHHSRPNPDRLIREKDWLALEFHDSARGTVPLVAFTTLQGSSSISSPIPDEHSGLMNNREADPQAQPGRHKPAIGPENHVVSVWVACRCNRYTRCSNVRLALSTNDQSRTPIPSSQKLLFLMRTP